MGRLLSLFRLLTALGHDSFDHVFRAGALFSLATSSFGFFDLNGGRELIAEKANQFTHPRFFSLDDSASYRVFEFVNRVGEWYVVDGNREGCIGLNFGHVIDECELQVVGDGTVSERQTEAERRGHQFFEEVRTVDFPNDPRSSIRQEPRMFVPRLTILKGIVEESNCVRRASVHPTSTTNEQRMGEFSGEALFRERLRSGVVVTPLRTTSSAAPVTS